ncbi:MAG: carbon storage regulator [Chromatiaceae bacterium]|nr:carbon storage regulator [Chromatiaceae bacterium]MCP5315968.1 carbon storage regulator [Chromatiaceae bacterium]
MLLLAHHERETIILETSDGPIELRLSGLSGEQTRIGIDAPPAVRVIRRGASHSGYADNLALDRALADEEDWWLHPDELAVASAGSYSVVNGD